jgi:hypothetical protein
MINTFIGAPPRTLLVGFKTLYLRLNDTRDLLAVSLPELSMDAGLYCSNWIVWQTLQRCATNSSVAPGNMKTSFEIF